MGWSYLDDKWMNVFLPSIRQTDYYIKEKCSQQIEGSHYPSSKLERLQLGHTLGYFKRDVETQEQVEAVSSLPHMTSRET